MSKTDEVRAILEMRHALKHYKQFAQEGWARAEKAEADLAEARLELARLSNNELMAHDRFVELNRAVVDLAELVADFTHTNATERRELIYKAVAHLEGAEKVRGQAGQ